MATKRLNLLHEIFQRTKCLKLILKLFIIEDHAILEKTLKFVTRDRLMDKDFPYKYLYRDAILD